MDLINKSKEIYSKLNIDELQKEGIQRESLQLYSHSHTIVTYPPLDALPEIESTKIYSIKDKKKKREIALYLHLPFCTGKCFYCAYITMANQPKGFIDKYIDSIEKEINMLLKFSVIQDVIVNSIYIGGGTPTYLSSAQLDRVFNLLKNKFSIKNDAEITVEAGPETIVAKDGKEKLKVLLKNGVNRLSMGFQTFNDDILKLINRRHNSKEAISAYKIAQDVGFKNINIDLMLGLPDQTLEILKDDLEQVHKLNPQSITCYPLHIKPTAPFYSMFQKEKQRFPNKENVLIMRIMTNEYFTNLGYNQNPIDWFTKNPKFVYKQQIHKWEESGEQLALGSSSYSFINNNQYFNYRTIPEYIEKVDSKKLPIWKGAKLSEEDLMRRFFVFGIRTGFSKKLFKTKFNKEPKEVFKETWKKLEKLGLIEENKEVIKLSYKGKLFSDEVSKEFYSDDVKKLIFR